MVGKLSGVLDRSPGKSRLQSSITVSLRKALLRQIWSMLVACSTSVVSQVALSQLSSKTPQGPAPALEDGALSGRLMALAMERKLRRLQLGRDFVIGTKVRRER
jgi:hypothetical protein